MGLLSRKKPTPQPAKAPAGPAPQIHYDKIFQIGFNKCATRAISRFFHRHGLTTADWAKGELAQDIAAAVAAGRAPLERWPDVTVFSDMEYVRGNTVIEGYRYFRDLHAAYPEALFILNTRNVEAWIRSRERHGDGGYRNTYRRHYKLRTTQEVHDRWRQDWFRHNLEVVEYFSGPRRDQLFVWDIERPDFETLSQKLGLPLKAEKWKTVGRT